MGQRPAKSLRSTIIALLKMSNFRYFNQNPVNSNINDCVCRAICNVTGLSYRTVDKLLSVTAKTNKCEKLCVCCYEKLLAKLGYTQYFCNNDETVKDIAIMYRKHKIIIRIKRHLTCAIYGIVEDTWDCSDNYVDCFWIYE